MFLLKSDNLFMLNSLSQPLNQKNFFFTTDENQKYFFEVSVQFQEKELQISSANKVAKIKLPAAINVIVSTIVDLMHDFVIEVNGAQFYPLKQSLNFQNKQTNLGDIHFVIFSQLVLFSKEGVNKTSLYKKIWPQDKDYQINKLDTHLTNLKNHLKDKLKYNLDFSSSAGLIHLGVN